MRRLPAVLLLATLFASSSICAGEDTKIDLSPFMPVVAVGLSYPLTLSVLGGVLLPLGKQDKQRDYPTIPALRIDGEVGPGGGSAAAGMYFPVGTGFAVSLKASRIRTWLWTWNVETNRTFDGGVVEFAALKQWPGKIGIGHFKDRDMLNNRRDSFTYLFLGFGW